MCFFHKKSTDGDGAAAAPPRALADQLRTSHSSAVDVDEPLLLYSPPDPERLQYTDNNPDAICAALRTDGCALLKAVIDPRSRCVSASGCAATSRCRTRTAATLARTSAPAAAPASSADRATSPSSRPTRQVS